MTQFETAINVGDRLSDSSQPSTKMSSVPKIVISSESEPSLQYRLQAVVRHIGSSVFRGHYLCDVYSSENQSLSSKVGTFSSNTPSDPSSHNHTLSPNEPSPPTPVPLGTTDSLSHTGISSNNNHDEKHNKTISSTVTCPNSSSLSETPSIDMTSENSDNISSTSSSLASLWHRCDDSFVSEISEVSHLHVLKVLNATFIITDYLFIFWYDHRRYL